MVDLDRKDFEQFVKFHTGENMVREKSAWEKFKEKDKLLIFLLGIAGLLAAASIFVLLTPVTNLLLNLFDLYIEGWAQLSTWLLGGDVGLGVALILGFLSLLFLLIARFRYLRDRSVYIDAGCPQCHDHELIRVRRYRRDRLFGFFGIPVRRYACRTCTWQGTRLAKYSTKVIKEKSENEGLEAGLEVVSPDNAALPGNGKVDIVGENYQELNEPPNLEMNN